MIVLRMVLVGVMALLLVSCGQKAEDTADTATTTEKIEDAGTTAPVKVEQPIMRREFEGALSQIQAGVHLQLKYDPEVDAFVGTMRNATIQPVAGAQVMVTLSDGTKLGPTDPIDLEPARPHNISLSAKGAEITAWSAQITTNTNKPAEKVKTE